MQIGVELGTPTARAALEHVSVVEQAVEQRRDRGSVPEELSPVVDRSVRGEDRGGALVAAHDELEQVLGGSVRDLSHAEIVDDEQRHGGELFEVGTTVVTKIELLRGRFDFLLKAATAREVLRAQEWLLKTERLLGDILVIPFDTRAAEHFERLRSTPALRKIGRADLLIASIALAHRATLVTRNIRHFRPIPSLTVENWID